MKKKYLLLLLFLLFCSIKKNETETDLKFLYVQEIPSLEAFQSVELNKKTLNIPWNSKVELKEIIDIKDSFSKIRFSYNEKDYYAKYSNFSESPPVLYMRVNVNSRLRLREKPNTNSQIIDTIPNGYVSKVDLIDPTIYNIEGKKGYWFQIKYNDKIGWIFSGFAITSSNESNLNWADNPNFEIQYLKSNIENLNSELRDYVIINEESINGYDIKQAELKTPSESDACREGKKIFISKKGSFLYKSPEFSTSSILFDYPVKNAIFLEHELCGCCCPNEDVSIIYLGKQPQKVPGFLTDRTMNCSYEFGQEIWTYEIQNRISSENENLKLIRTPDCYDFFDSNFDIDSSQSIVPKKFTNEFFVYIKYGSIANIEVFKNQGIPTKFKNLWENSK